jgi:Protein of unknown function (DUF2515)
VSTPTLPRELAGVLRRFSAEHLERNRDNVARTKSYLELYALTREADSDWPWLLMAHLVSRNAGYLMVDLAQAIDHEGRVFTREALVAFFAMLERANFLIFFDAWHHVLVALDRGDAFAGDAATTGHMKRAYAAYFAGAAVDAKDRERRLVLDLVTNEQRFIEHRVVHHPAFAGAMSLLAFIEKSGHERPMVLPLTSAKITVGGFADVSRRIETGRRLYDEVLGDRVLRAEIYAWALETPHTGSRAAHGGKPGPKLREAWPLERVRAISPALHAPPEPDPRWP